MNARILSHIKGMQLGKLDKSKKQPFRVLSTEFTDIYFIQGYRDGYYGKA